MQIISYESVLQKKRRKRYIKIVILSVVAIALTLFICV
nr:MAG TPA_asm: Sigma factor regulator N-terminal [Caudoviricetes sp.]